MAVLIWRSMDQRWETKNTGRASPIEVRTGTKLRRTDIAIFGSLCTASGQQRTKHLIDAVSRASISQE